MTFDRWTAEEWRPRYIGPERFILSRRKQSNQGDGSTVHHSGAISADSRSVERIAVDRALKELTILRTRTYFPNFFGELQVIESYAIGKNL
jgi:hypothetical protein